MGLMSKFNLGNAFNDIDTKDFEYVSLEDIYNVQGLKPLQVNGVFINNKGKYGPSAVAISIETKKLINLPTHEVENVQDMLKDDVVIDAFKKGRVAIQTKPYTNAYSGKGENKKEFYSCVWVDL